MGGVRALWAIQPQVDTLDPQVLGKQYLCPPEGGQDIQKKSNDGSNKNVDHERRKDGSLPPQG